MNRRSIAILAVGVLIGYFANDPNSVTLVGIVVASGVAFLVFRWTRDSALTLEVDPLDQDHLAYELTRARRFGRPLGLVVARPTDGTWSPADRSIFEAVGTRRIDRVWMHGDTLFILLPETDRNGANILIRRMEAALAAGSLQTASAVFPVDAVTSGGLVQGALSQLNGAESVRLERAADSVN